MAPSDDEQLESAFELVAPSTAQLERVERRLHGSFEVPPKPLWLEWVELLRLRPVLHGGLAVANVVLLGFLSPLAHVLVALLREASRGS